MKLSEFKQRQKKQEHQGLRLLEIQVVVSKLGRGREINRGDWERVLYTFSYFPHCNRKISGCTVPKSHALYCRKKSVPVSTHPTHLIPEHIPPIYTFISNPHFHRTSERTLLEISQPGLCWTQGLPSFTSPGKHRRELEHRTQFRNSGVLFKFNYIDWYLLLFGNKFFFLSPFTEVLRKNGFNN